MLVLFSSVGCTYRCGVDFQVDVLVHLPTPFQVPLA